MAPNEEYLEKRKRQTLRYFRIKVYTSYAYAGYSSCCKFKRRILGSPIELASGLTESKSYKYL